MLAHIVYRKCAFIIKLLDQIVEAIMVRTIYRPSDRQKNVIMNILILVGVGVVNELTRLLIFDFVQDYGSKMSEPTYTKGEV